MGVEPDNIPTIVDENAFWGVKFILEFFAMCASVLSDYKQGFFYIFLESLLLMEKILMSLV